MLNFTGLFGKVEVELKRMTIIKPIETPTDWCEVESALDSAKKLISGLPSLQYFSLSRQVLAFNRADASSYGLDAVSSTLW